MTQAKSIFNGKAALKLSLAALGTLLVFSPLAQAAQVNPSSSNSEQTASVIPNSRETLLARNSVCPSYSGGSQFVSAETKNFYVYICGGDLPNTYVGIPKYRKGGIVLPLRSYNKNKFVAVNGNYRYTLTRNQLIVTQNGRTIVKEWAKWRY